MELTPRDPHDAPAGGLKRAVTGAVALEGRRRAVGGGAVVDLQYPERPERIEPYEFTVAQVGELSYRGIAQGWPVDDEQMRWEMTYLTLEGERILIEDTATYVYRHPAPDTVRAEAAAVGLTLGRIGNSSYWLLTR